MNKQSQRPSLCNLLRRTGTGSFLGLLTLVAFFAVFGGSNFLSATGAASWLDVAASPGIVVLPIG